MVRLGTLLRRSPRQKDQPEVEAPAKPRFLGPPLMVLIPDVAGVSSFRLYTFPDSEAATGFVLSLSRQQRERAHAFWALQDEPTAVPDGDDATGEATVLIRASEGSDLVYVVSFVDIASAQSFARFEVKRGMHLGLMLVYWASMVNVVLTEDRVQLVPEFPPRIDRRRQDTRPRTSETHKLRPLAEAQGADASVSPEQKNGHQTATALDSTQAEVEAEEQRRLAAEAEAHRRIAAEAAELRDLLAEEDEKQRIAAEEEEQRRLEAAAPEQQRVEAEAAEQRLIAAEEKRRLAAQEEERHRLEAEAAEQQQVEAEAAEQRRIAAEAEEERRLAAEAEEQRLLAAEVEEKRRLEAEAAEERRLEAEAEAEQQRRVEAEAQEQQRIAAQAEEWRRQAEAEDNQRQRLEAEERASLEAEAEERLRQAAEAQAERDRAAEAEMQRLREAIMEEQRRLDAEADVGHGDLPAHDSELDREPEEAPVGMQTPQQTDEISGELSQPTGEAPNPIEELLEQEAQTRAQIPHEFTKYTPPDGVEPAVQDEDDANIADEVSKILRRRRWDKRESPFEGFNSPPGRF